MVHVCMVWQSSHMPVGVKVEKETAGSLVTATVGEEVDVAEVGKVRVVVAEAAAGLVIAVEVLDVEAVQVLSAVAALSFGSHKA